MEKRLAVFDFDQTIVNYNSDTVLRGLLPKEAIPKFKQECWTTYMQLVFDLLYQHKIREDIIKKTICELEPVSGMQELIVELTKKLNFDIIIISDANLYIINTWLQQHGLDTYITKVFSNPAEFVEGMLKIKFHSPLQYSCNLSSPNLCKGDVLEDFIRTQKNIGIIYNQIVYVGDGLNDLCPMLRLGSRDIACFRKGFYCEKVICNIIDGKPVRKKLYSFTANRFCWNTGFEILSNINM